MNEKPEDDKGEDATDGIENTAPPSPVYATLSDINLDLAMSEVAKEKKPLSPETKKKILYGGVGAFVALILLAMFLTKSSSGNMAYGICSTYLELNTPYPQTLQHTDYEMSNTVIRIYFTSTDPFGQYKQEMLECTFGADPVMGMKITQIARNRRAVDAGIVEKFNLLIPTIIASDPYRELPPRWKNPLLKD